MKKLKAILREAEVLKNDMAGDWTELTVAKLDSLARSQSIAFWVLFLVLLGLVGFGVYIVLALVAGQQSSSDITALVTALGLTAGSGGLVQVMRSVWTEWSRTQLLAVALRESTPTDAVTLVQTFVKTMR